MGPFPFEYVNRFSDLPRSVRDAIYAELFTKPSAIDVSEVMGKILDGQDENQNIPWWDEDENHELGLLRCSARISREATLILYRTNKFVVHQPGLKSLHKFLQMIGKTNCRNLRFLQLALQPSPSSYSTKKGRTWDKSYDAHTDFDKSCQLLRETHLDTLEIKLDFCWGVVLESHFGNLKAENLVVQSHLNAQPTLEALKTMWTRRLVLVPSDSAGLTEEMSNMSVSDQSCISTFHFGIKTVAREIDLRVEACNCDYFSRLPPEIKNVIYEMLLEQDHEIRPLESGCDPGCEIDDNKFSNTKTSLWMAAGLLRASKRIHDEVTSILFGTNVFSLFSYRPGSISLWLAEIGVRNRSRLRYVRIDADLPFHQMIDTESSWFVDDTDDRCNLDIPHDLSCKTLQQGLMTIDGPVLTNVAAIRQLMVEFTASEVEEDHVKSLDLLKSCTSISRLEIKLPRSGCIITDKHGPYFEMDEFRDTTYNRVLQCVLELRIYRELRISGFNDRGDLDVLWNNIEVEEIVAFGDDNSSRYFARYIAGPFGVGCRTPVSWDQCECKGAMRSRLKPATITPTEKRIDAIWPKPHVGCRWEHFPV